MKKLHIDCLGRCMLMVAVAMLVINVSGVATAADFSKSILTIKAENSSKEAIAALDRRFGKSDHLFYLYNSQENDDLTVALSFPGRLLVAPDQTTLEALLSTTHPGATISAEPEAAIAFFKNATAPVAKVVDEHDALVGIIATKADMEPLRTGAVVRHSGAEDAHEDAAVHAETASHDLMAKTAPQSTARRL